MRVSIIPFLARQCYIKGGIEQGMVIDIDGKPPKGKEILEAWWDEATKKRSSRNDYLRRAAWSKGTVGADYHQGITMCVQKVMWWTRVFRETEGEPWVIRRAKALAVFLDYIPVFIIDQSQVVGYAGSRPSTIIMQPESSYLVCEDLLYDKQGYIPAEDKEWVREALSYWKDKCFQAIVDRYLTDEEQKVIKMGLGVMGQGHIDVQSSALIPYENVYRLGLEGIIRQTEDNLSEAENSLHSGAADPTKVDLIPKIDQWRAMLIVARAAIRWAKRYSRLARIVAENFEPDPQHRSELMQISEVCAQVPAKPVQNFREAVQCHHLITLLCKNHERPHVGWSFRPDQLWWPYYERDVKADKILTRQQVQELLEEWEIRVWENTYQVPRFWREGRQGISGPWVVTIGGVKEDGSDACNELTEIICDATAVIRTSEPSVSFRYHPKASISALRAAFECLKQGNGRPSFKNDEVNIKQLMGNFGASLEEARSWANVVCMSPGVNTDRGQAVRYASPLIFISKVVEYALYDGCDSTITGLQMGPHTGDASRFTTWEEFQEAVRLHIRYIVDLACRTKNICRFLETKYYQQPLLSCMFQRCVEGGYDAVEPRELPNCWFTVNTMGDLCESMYPIKKLVFDDKKYTMQQLIDALKADWVGYEQMQHDFIDLPKWGNDNDEVDRVYADTYKVVVKEFKRNVELSGGKFLPLPNTNSTQAFAPRMGALPYGKRKGEYHTDGGCSPVFGMDKRGPTAVLRSVGKLDAPSCKGILLNQRFSPTQLGEEKGFQLWMQYMKTWYDFGIDHVQFNVVDNETLRAAQKEPEKYTELIVRVAGWSSHFVELNRLVQDSIIARTVQEV